VKNEGIGITYFRHSLVSSALAQISKSDPLYGKKVAELALKTYHSVKSQQRSYLTPLKDGNNKLVTIDQYAFEKAYDEPTIAGENINEAGDQDDEVGSKLAPIPESLPKPKKKPATNTRKKNVVPVVVPTRKSARQASKK
jgi:hypothetical protein